MEAAAAAGMDGSAALLVLGFESAEIPQGELIRHAVDIARDAGGVIDLGFDRQDGRVGDAHWALDGKAPDCDRGLPLFFVDVEAEFFQLGRRYIHCHGVVQLGGLVVVFGDLLGVGYPVAVRVFGQRRGAVLQLPAVEDAVAVGVVVERVGLDRVVVGAPGLVDYGYPPAPDLLTVGSRVVVAVPVGGVGGVDPGDLPHVAELVAVGIGVGGRGHVEVTLGEGSFRPILHPIPIGVVVEGHCAEGGLADTHLLALYGSVLITVHQPVVVHIVNCRV